MTTDEAVKQDDCWLSVEWKALFTFWGTYNACFLLFKKKSKKTFYGLTFYIFILLIKIFYTLDKNPLGETRWLSKLYYLLAAQASSVLFTPLPRDAEDFLRDDKFLKDVPLPTFLSNLQPI